MVIPTSILIIDDSEDDIDYFLIVLREIYPRIEIKTASYCTDLISDLSSSNDPIPDYIFLDFKLPKMNGFDCLKEIRKLPKYANVPIVIFTPSVNEEDKTKALGMGASHFCIKPDTLEDFRRELRDILNFSNPTR